MAVSHSPAPMLHIPLITLSRGPCSGWFLDDWVRLLVHWPEDDQGRARSRPCEGPGCHLCRGGCDLKWHYLVPALRELEPLNKGSVPTRREQRVGERDWLQRLDALPPEQQRQLLTEATKRFAPPDWDLGKPLPQPNLPLLRDAAARILRQREETSPPKSDATQLVRQAVVLDLPEGCIADLARRLGPQPWRGIRFRLCRSSGRGTLTKIELSGDAPDDLARSFSLTTWCAARWTYPTRCVVEDVDEKGRSTQTLLFRSPSLEQAAV